MSLRVERRRAVFGVICAGLGAASPTACTDDAGPRLDSVSPAAAGRNALVVISGRRLCGVTGDCGTAAGEVLIGLGLPTVRATVVSYSDTSAQLAIPMVTPVGSTELVVTVNDRSSNALAFEVLP